MDETSRVSGTQNLRRHGFPGSYSLRDAIKIPREGVFLLKFCASATLPASLQSWPALALPVLGKFHFNSSSDTTFLVHDLEFLAIAKLHFTGCSEQSLRNISITPHSAEKGEGQESCPRWQASSTQFSHPVAATKSIGIAHIVHPQAPRLFLRPPQIQRVQTSQSLAKAAGYLE